MKTKKEWRTLFMQQRQALSPTERDQKSIQVSEQYHRLFQQERPEVVHLFLPIANKAEVDTGYILRWLNKEYPKVKTVTSVIAEDQVSLLTLEVRSDSLLVYNSWGIPEPAERLLFPEQHIQEVLTPLLAADHNGFRLGYGKGFYDRFFQKCPHTVMRTGINFFPMTTETLPKDEWDIALHRLVSPEGVEKSKESDR